MEYNFVFRTRIILIAVAFSVLVIVCRLYYVQIIKGEVYRSKAENQYIKPSTQGSDRGSIFLHLKMVIKSQLRP